MSIAMIDTMTEPAIRVRTSNRSRRGNQPTSKSSDRSTSRRKAMAPPNNE